MNRIPFIVGTLAMVAMLGCAPKNDQPTDVLPMSYMDAATALAADDFDKAKISLTALTKETSGEMQTKAQSAANAANIAEMRTSFKELSVIASQMQLPTDYAVAFCPMYKGGSKWVQKKETLANPYYGKTMLTCGNFVN